jgi:hypothetical protein
VSAFPTLLQLPLRRVVAHSGDEVFVGWVGGPSDHPIAWERFDAARGPLVEAARRTPEVRLFEWFARGKIAPRVEERGAVVEFDDLRCGVPGRPRDGLWGVRVRLDAAGRPVGVERFHRALPAATSEILGRLWQQTRGSS